MSLASKADLKSKAASWLRRSGNAAYVAEVPDFITLAEARLNRELGAVETDASLTGTPGSAALNVSALAIVTPLALFMTEPGGSDEAMLQPQPAANVAAQQDVGRPVAWFVNSSAALGLNCPCDVAYGFRLRFLERFALSADGDTNWLLTNHPDLYLAATLMWGAGYLESWENGAVWKGLLSEGLAEVKRQLADRKRGTLRVDSGLLAMGGGLR